MGRLGVLTVVLAALSFILAGRSEATTPSHHHHGVTHEQSHAGHHQAIPQDQGTESASRHADDGSHRGGCHCRTAACVSALPVAVPDHVMLALPRDRHELALVESAPSLAGVIPPPKPPRL